MRYTVIHDSALLPLAAILIACGLTSSAAQPQSLCAECLSVRLGPPKIVRGPSGQESDAPFVVIKLATANSAASPPTTAPMPIDGATPVDMGGTKRVVHAARPQGHAVGLRQLADRRLPIDGKLVGLVHGESDCDYDKGRTHKAMAIATSADEGLDLEFPRRRHHPHRRGDGRQDDRRRRLHHGRRRRRLSLCLLPAPGRLDHHRGARRRAAISRPGNG